MANPSLFSSEPLPLLKLISTFTAGYTVFALYLENHNLGFQIQIGLSVFVLSCFLWKI